MPNPSDREPRVGDVHAPLIVTGLSTCTGLVRDFLAPDGEVRTYHGDDLEVGNPDFNLFDLLSGDPAAWAEALRFAPEVFLLEVGEGEEKRQVVGLPKGLFLSDLILEEQPQKRQGRWMSVKRRGRTYYADLATPGLGGRRTSEHAEGHGPDFTSAVRAALGSEKEPAPNAGKVGEA